MQCLDNRSLQLSFENPPDCWSLEPLDADFSSAFLSPHRPKVSIKPNETLFSLFPLSRNLSSGSFSSLPMAATPINTIASAIHRIQLALLAGVPSSSPDLLTAAGALLSAPDYADVVTERTIAGDCGYPLCSRPLPKSPSSSHKVGGRYHIALREHRVYDLEESRRFCSERCLIDSAAFAAALPPERPFDLAPAKVERLVKLFEVAQEDKLGLGFGTEKNKGRSLEIKEKEGRIGDGEVSVDEWMGPADAIEGYVPKTRHDYEQGEIDLIHGVKSNALLAFDTCIGVTDLAQNAKMGKFRYEKLTSSLVSVNFDQGACHNA